MSADKQTQPRRTFSPTRYQRRMGFCLDHDSGGYTNRFTIFDTERGFETGIQITETGHSAFPGGHKCAVWFQDREFPKIRDAIFAYEDSRKPSAESASAPEKAPA